MTPKTRRAGEAAAIKMLWEFDQETRKRWAPVAHGALFDKRMREAMAFPRAARLGFTYVVGDWLATGVMQCTYGLDGYEHSLLKRRKRGTNNAA
jgi:hypothetical protein